MSDTSQYPTGIEPPEDLIANRTYASWLKFTVLLVLATVTVVIVLIIISSSRADRREEQFQVTLTAVFSQLAQTQTAGQVTPTPAPAVTFGEYVFELAPDSPAYSAGPECDRQRVGGQVLDQNGQPTDAFAVRVWGDYTPLHTVTTGPLSGQPNGRWEVALAGSISRRVWVQLGAGDRYFSAPVEVVFEADACERNRAEIVLVQVGPLP